MIVSYEVNETGKWNEKESVNWSENAKANVSKSECATVSQTLNVSDIYENSFLCWDSGYVDAFEGNGCNFYYGFGDDTGLPGLSLPAFQASVSLVLFSWQFQ